ncbi:MAG TPA: cellulase family glycosylhydrolase, partial [Chitinophagaceae bacterium]|nr:cellulase family glycosylhydrolase [Chitinophagaceae bacterium]
MMGLKKTLFILLIFASSKTYTQGFLHAEGKKIMKGKEEVILRGMGLGGWMLQEPYMLQLNGIANNQISFKNKIVMLIGKENTERFYDAWLSNHCTKKDIDSLAAWGFNSVRLPMHYKLFTLPVEEEKNPSENTWLSKGFTLTDSLLSWCKANKMYLILDLHAAPGGQGSDIPISDRDTSKASLWQSEANRNKTIALWKELAKRYADEEWIGGYDLLNETNWGFENPGDKNGCSEKLNTELKSLLTAITKEIRTVDKNHIIFIEGNCWANNYNGMFPLWDNNIVVSFHKYWNNNDRSAIEGFLKIREEQDVPLWMGESGENSNAWYTDAISLLETNHIGWAWWPLKKLGSNNPLQIKQPAGYQKLLKYWRGEEKELTKTEATTILMELAKATRIENNILHPDVVDAMFRQVRLGETKPFKANIVRDKFLFYASDYDKGRSGIAYHDSDSGNYWVSTKKRTSWNKGGQYRNDGVDIGVCNDSLTNGYSIGWTEEGEWLQYTLTVPVKGWYMAKIRAKSNADDLPGTLAFLLDDKKIAGDIVLQPNQSITKWNT